MSETTGWESGRIEPIKASEQLCVNVPYAAPPCTWIEMRGLDGDTYYKTACDQADVMIGGTPQENYYRYCPYCGGRITVIAAKADDEDDEDDEEGETDEHLA